MNAPANSKHSSATAEHGTPPEIIDPMREVLGGVDIDPCSNADFNRIVQARWYCSLSGQGAAGNGFACDWSGTVWLNPPGGTCDAYGMPSPRVGSRQVRRPGDVNSPRAWFERLVKFHVSGRVTAFGFEAFSIEQLQTLQTIQEPYPKVTDFWVCIPAKRIRHMQVAPDGELVRGNAPTHASAIVYAGPNPRTFKRLFSRLGATGKLR